MAGVFIIYDLLFVSTYTVYRIPRCRGSDIPAGYVPVSTLSNLSQVPIGMNAGFSSFLNET